MESSPAHEGQRTYQTVLRHIEAGILDGHYRSGDQLPSERELASQLNVGRSAVREAMRVLETAGLIAVSTGRGGGTRLMPAQGDALARIFRLHLAISGAGIDDLAETRIALERASAATAARTAGARTRAELAATIAQMRQADTVEAFAELDTTFHVQLARAGRNDLVTDLTVAIREAVRAPIRTASERLADWADLRPRLIQEHADILDAIADGDPDRAAALMETHIRSAYADLASTGLTS